MVYSAFYDNEGKEIFIPKGVSVKESQAGEILTRLFKTMETKIQNNQPPRPPKKHDNIIRKQISEQSKKIGTNKETYKNAIEKFLKELEEFEKTNKKTKDEELKKSGDALIVWRNNKIIFRK